MQHHRINLDGADISIADIRTVTPEDSQLVAKTLPQRFQRSQTFAFQEDRLRCLAAGLLLIQQLGLTSEDQLAYGENGKPSAAGRKAFNLSHSGNYAALAQADFPLGVDIEFMQERHLKVAKRVFVPSELDWMGKDPLTRFHLLWTQKEAVMKLTGRGLGLDPRSFTVNPQYLGAVSVPTGQGPRLDPRSLALDPATATTSLDGKAIQLTSTLYDDCALSVARFLHA